MLHTSSFFLTTCCLSLILCFHETTMAQTKVSFATLTENQNVNGFKAVSVYLNDANQPMGGRFIHQRSGFTLDLLQIESVPQTYIWVRTFPVSDKGEPHTQEHLLITKGNKGHELNTREGMSLAASNAFTSQLHTAYHFNTAAGGGVFYDLFEKYLDALLHPDYTDEEVKREVRNWGVTENPSTKTLRVEEKGSVYNEMSVSMNNPNSVLFNTMGRMLYGDVSPLSYSAGGLPSAIRELGPAEIKKFHSANYHLGNMGAITSLPKNMTLPAVLSQMDKILNTLEPVPLRQKYDTENDLQPAKGTDGGKIKIVEYPDKNAQESGSMVFVYPHSVKLSPVESIMLDGFLSVITGDANTNLYKKFIDSKTKQIDLGATGVFGGTLDNVFRPVYIFLTGITAENLTAANAVKVRQAIKDELLRISAFKDNSPELLEFNKRLKNSGTDYKRSLAKFVNSPPKFGFRNTFTSWYDQLDFLSKTDQFRKSIILNPQFAEIEARLATGKNFWKDEIHKWKLEEIDPYVVISKADPSLMEKMESEKQTRADAEIARLKTKYNVDDDQEAIRMYKKEYDADTHELEKLEKAHTVKFIDNPPLTLDDQLDYKVQTLPGNVKVVASTFNNMTSATTGIALNLNTIAENQLVYLAILPQLLTSTGVIKNGKAISYDEMSELLRQEILSLNANYSTNFNTGRAELVVRSAGNNLQESQKAIEWMDLVLQNPNWRMENIGRIRDVVDQGLTSARKRMQGSEESWVQNPNSAYFRQNNPLLLSTASFLTQSHNIHRLRWMLKDAGNQETNTSTGNFLIKLANARGTRDELKALLGNLQTERSKAKAAASTLQQYVTAFDNLPASARSIAIDAAKDMQQILNEIPDDALALDWSYLLNQMQKDLNQGPEKTLEALQNVRKSLLRTSNARMFIIGSAATQQKLSSNINNMLSRYNRSPATPIKFADIRHIDERVKQRMNTTSSLVFVGLVNPNSQTGVFMNSAPLTAYTDTGRDKLLDFLAAQLHGGAGPVSVYTKTTGAGLSYSTGVGASPSSGRISYYAERTPELPQTLRFVIDEVKRSPKDTSVTDYIIAHSVSAVRSDNDYEVRGESMAADLADNITPATIKTFRKAILKLRRDPTLMDEVYKRKDKVYEKILPGYGIRSKDVAGAQYFVIGPEKQIAGYEAYLKSRDGKDTQVFRLYPRDYWLVGK